MTATVADCERVQRSWFQLRSRVLGGDAWEDDGLVWANGDLMFPQVIDPAALARGVERARAQGARTVGAWLSPDVDPRPLAAAGFERGWEPWWMAGPIDLGGIPADARVELQESTTDYRGIHAGYAADLAMARLRPARAWYAAAYDEGRFAGRAWSHQVGDLAGVFDVDVWQPFQRRGLGTGLMQAVCSAAAVVGAQTVVLNSTPTGVRLYEKCGLERIGTGITWWLHLPIGAGPSPGASHSL
ncbi:GNAT family N-acetyltransferase [Cellulomonas sp.]|uniref:GNAT family N-acetyltransferase n=1 Tax=Cellulomonas sp. TaxID=40001 RepID=UPI003BAD8D5C